MYRWHSLLAPSDEGAAAAAAEGEKAAVNRKLSIVVTFLSLRASPTSLVRGRLWAAAAEGEKAALNRKPGLSSPWAPSDEGAVAAATEGEKAAVNRKLSIIATVLSLRASPTSLIRGRLRVCSTHKVFGLTAYYASIVRLPIQT